MCSIAKSLGAKTCSKKLLEYYLDYEDKIESVVVTDADVVHTMSRFLGELKIYRIFCLK